MTNLTLKNGSAKYFKNSAFLFKVQDAETLFKPFFGDDWKQRAKGKNIKITIGNKAYYFINNQEAENYLSKRFNKPFKII